MRSATAPVTVPDQPEPRSAETLRPVHATFDVASSIGDDLDVNEHRRDQLASVRDRVIGEVARRRVDSAIGCLARAHTQLSRALDEVEKAGGAS